MDATLAASGNGSWKMLAVDAVLMAAPGAGRLVSRSVKTARGPTLRGVETGTEQARRLGSEGERLASTPG